MAATVGLMIRALLALAVVVPLAASCDKGGSTQTPEPAPAPEATEPEGALVADASDGDDSEDEQLHPADMVASAADGGEDAAPGDGGETSGTDAPEPTTEPTPEPTVEPEPTTAPTKTALKLPKPIHTSVKKSCGKDPGVGQKLKSFKLPTTEEGKTYSNGSFRGRVMLVNFWGTWCKPCLKELPKFAQLYRRYRKHGMTLLAIATDDDAAAVKDTLAAKKIAAKVAIAGEEYAGKYESPQFPFTFVVDHRGVIQASYFGYEPDCMGKLEADIRAQLEKRADAKK